MCSYYLALRVAGYEEGAHRGDDGDESEHDEGDHGEARDPVSRGDCGAALRAGGAYDTPDAQAREEDPVHSQDQVDDGGDRGGGQRVAARHQLRSDATPPERRWRRRGDRSVGVGHEGVRGRAKP